MNKKEKKQELLRLKKKLVEKKAKKNGNGKAKKNPLTFTVILPERDNVPAEVLENDYFEPNFPPDDDDW